MKRFTIIIFLALFLFSAGPTFPQQCPNSIYFEILGNGGLYSMNYDRMFTAHVGGRIGFSYLSFDQAFIFPAMTLYIFPVSFNYFVGEGNSKLELGVGMTIVNGDFDWFGVKGSGSGVIPNLNVGYRFQPVGGGFLFRIGFTPMFTSAGIRPWGGLSIGAAF